MPPRGRQQLKRGRPKSEVDTDKAEARRVLSTFFLPRTAAPANADPGPAAAANEAAEAAAANAAANAADADPGPYDDAIGRGFFEEDYDPNSIEDSSYDSGDESAQEDFGGQNVCILICFSI